jgi:hypothetical protein
LIGRSPTTISDGNNLFLKPQFLIIGAQRSGTSSLFHYLSQHPDLSLPKVKELHFFDMMYDMGFEWYCEQFPRRDHSGDKMTGEASPYYLFHPLVPSLAARHLPDVKLIVLLRNPVDRAWSHYYHSREIGVEPLETFEEAIAAEAGRIGDDDVRLANGELSFSFSHQHHSYLSRGFYAGQIRRWKQYFRADQFLFLRSDDFYCNAAEALEKVCQFLMVNHHLPPDISAQNTLNHPEISVTARENLLKRYTPDSLELKDLTGHDFSWE